MRPCVKKEASAISATVSPGRSSVETVTSRCRDCGGKQGPRADCCGPSSVRCSKKQENCVLLFFRLRGGARPAHSPGPCQPIRPAPAPTSAGSIRSRGCARGASARWTRSRPGPALRPRPSAACWPRLNCVVSQVHQPGSAGSRLAMWRRSAVRASRSTSALRRAALSGTVGAGRRISAS